MDNKVFRKKLFSLVVPIAFDQFMTALVSACDAVMLGKLSQDSMSAVSLASQMQFVFSLFTAAMTIGTSMFAAQFWGNKDVDAVERVLAIVLRITVVIALIFTFAAAFVPSVLMRILTDEPLLIEYGTEYLRTVSLSYFFCGISRIYLCVMKNCGRVVQSSAISCFCVILNIILNALMIFGLCGFPEMGIKGAAVATVIARFVELLWSLADSLGKNRVKIRRKYFFSVDKVLRKSFWKYTSPVLGNELVWGGGMAMGTVITGHLGSDAVAANSIANIVKNLIVCFCIGIGSGGGIMVGNELGAGNSVTAKKYGDKLMKLSLVSGLITGLLLIVLIPLIRQTVELTETADSYLIKMLIICAVYMAGKAINCTAVSGIFCAGGDSKFGFICDTVTLWAIIVPLGLTAAFVLDLPVPLVYLIINLDEFVKLPAVINHYKKYKWIKNLTQEAKGEV